LRWPADAGRTQERRADGGDRGAGPGFGQTSIAFTSGRPGPWPDEAVLQKIRELVLPGIERQGRIEAWIVDDTGFTKKGTHSVGVARQYCGRLGKQDNCQIAVTLSIANHSASLPIAYRLYLPETWANDAARRKKTHVPKDVRFKTKPQIALDQIRAAHAAGVAPGIVLADAGYGANSDFRAVSVL